MNVHKRICLIAAISKDQVIGKDGDLPWSLKDDLRLFSNLTKHQAVIMGRKNYESIGKPLPNRLNIIMSRNLDYSADGCIVVSDIEEAIEAAGDRNAYVIGGSEIYRMGLKYADVFFRTTVDANIAPSDKSLVYFPRYNEQEWESHYSMYKEKDENNEHSFVFEMLVRKK